MDNKRHYYRLSEINIKFSKYNFKNTTTNNFTSQKSKGNIANFNIINLN